MNPPMGKVNWTDEQVQEGKNFLAEHCSNYGTKNAKRLELSKHFGRQVCWPVYYKFDPIHNSTEEKPKPQKVNPTSEPKKIKEVVKEVGITDVLDFIKKATVEDLMSTQNSIDNRKVELVDSVSEKEKQLEAELKAIKSFMDRK